MHDDFLKEDKEIKLREKHTLGRLGGTYEWNVHEVREGKDWLEKYV